MNRDQKKNQSKNLSINTLNQSQAIRANGQIFVSGQIPADASANLVSGSISDKTQACCDNIKAILDAAGSSVQKIVKVNVCLLSVSSVSSCLLLTGKPVREFPVGFGK